MQAPSHASLPAGHVAAQAPPLQTRPSPQLVPHVPQFAGSFVVSTQASPHRAQPVSHTKSQVLSVQIAVACAGASQVWSHVPQRLASDVRSAQALPHAVKPLVQEKPQVPALHDGMPPVGAAQVLEQLPQCSTLLERSTHAPSHGSSSPGQPSAHDPSAHTWSEAQATPHRPQFPGSSETSTHVEQHSV